MGKDSPQAQRLRRLRQAEGFNVAADFAENLGITPSRWNNFEVGYPLSRSVARLLMQRMPGLSLDWLEHGRTDGLSLAMARKLGEMPAEIRAPTTRTARNRR